MVERFYFHFIRRSRHHRSLRWVIALLVFIGLATGSFLSGVSAQISSEEMDAANSLCLGCHSNQNMNVTLESGEVLPLGVDHGFYNTSIHGEHGITCLQCHTNLTGFPHPEMTAKTQREYTVERNRACGTCHVDVAEATMGSVHQVLQEEGNLNSAVCTDCHSSHDTRPLVEQRNQTAHTCQRCHSEIYELYKSSVHGAALIGEGNPDVPNCITCHGAHDISGPLNEPFRLFSPNLCGKCHANRELMSKYNISTDVMDTWVSDFHGTTVVMFQTTTPDQETDKAVCIDCHGVHNILAPSDPNSYIMKENLLTTCRKCHPAATANFPDAWMNHYRPSFQNYPIVFFVTWFYWLLIPAVIGGMLIFVISDFFRMKIDAKKERFDGQI